MATGISVVRNANLYTLTVNTGAKIEDIYIGKIAVEGNVGSGVIQIIYEGNLYVQGLYGQFIDGSGNPLGGSVAAVEAAIAALLYLPSGGSGGSCCPLVIGTSASNNVTVTSGQISSGQNVLQLLGTGTVNVDLPNPATVTVGAILRLSMQGGAKLTLTPFASETLDGQTVNTTPPTAGVWPIPQPSYIVSSGYYPAQSVSLYTDGTNWFTAQIS